MATRIAVFTASQNPATDQPSERLPKKDAEHQVFMGRASFISKRAIRLKATPSDIPCDVLIAAGYDQAVITTPVTDFRQVWGMRSSAGIDMWQYTANQSRSSASAA